MSEATVCCPYCGKENTWFIKYCKYCRKRLHGTEENWQRVKEIKREIDRINLTMAQPENYIPVTPNKSKHNKRRHSGMEFTEEELLVTGLYPHTKHGFFKGLLISNIFGKK